MHYAYQPSCPYSLLTYALLSRLLSHFGLFELKTTWIHVKYTCQPPFPPSPSQPLKIITIGHHAYQPSCPYSLLTYALLLRLLSHFGFRVTNVHLSVCLSIIHQNPSTSQNHNYWPSCLSAIMPIQPSDLGMLSKKKLHMEGHCPN